MPNHATTTPAFDPITATPEYAAMLAHYSKHASQAEAAARAAQEARNLLAPSEGMVMLFSFLFGLLGIISAVHSANRARALGLSTGPYWSAWRFGLLGQALVGGVVLWLIN
jgi:hypothetical protein